MAVASSGTVKLAMAMTHPFGEEETRRQQQLRAQRVMQHRAQLRAELHRKISGQVRRVFGFLLSATIVLFIVSHLTKIDSTATKQVGRTVILIQTKAAASPLRQSALNYEKEVDEIASR